MNDRIQIHPDICNGKAIIKDTRITVSTVLEFLSAGDTIEDILEAYPNLSREDVLACLQYAHHLTKNHTAIA
jgi:uncharacterized protein (DUF433 family)